MNGVCVVCAFVCFQWRLKQEAASAALREECAAQLNSDQWDGELEMGITDMEMTERSAQAPVPAQIDVLAQMEVMPQLRDEVTGTYRAEVVHAMVQQHERSITALQNELATIRQELLQHRTQAQRL